jgi:hypothetical protein
MTLLQSRVARSAACLYSLMREKRQERVKCGDTRQMRQVGGGVQDRIWSFRLRDHSLGLSEPSRRVDAAIPSRGLSPHLCRPLGHTYGEGTEHSVTNIVPNGLFFGAYTVAWAGWDAP